MDDKLAVLMEFRKEMQQKIELAHALFCRGITNEDI